MALAKDEGKYQVLFSTQRCRSMTHKSQYSGGGSLFLLNNILTKSEQPTPKNLSYCSSGKVISEEKMENTAPEDKRKNQDTGCMSRSSGSQLNNRTCIEHGYASAKNSKRTEPPFILSKEDEEDVINLNFPQEIVYEDPPSTNSDIFQRPVAIELPESPPAVKPQFSQTTRAHPKGLERFLNPAKKSSCPQEPKTAVHKPQTSNPQNVNIISINIGSITQSTNKYFTNTVSKSKGRYLAQAYESFNTGHYKNAVLLFSKVLSGNEAATEAYLYRGLASLKMGDRPICAHVQVFAQKEYELCSESLARCRETVELCERENKQKYLLKLARLLVVNGQPSKALTIANNMLYEEQDKAIFALRGTIHSMLENPLKAIEDFDKAKGKFYKADHYYHKAKSLIKLARHDEALDTLNQGINTFPNFPLLLQERAQYSFQEQQIEEYGKLRTCSRKQWMTIVACQNQREMKKQWWTT
eukprot:TRINITY_DN193_c0_g1_i3.p1 TRINITY_DN193_c0_g1~~TRINITY_DN193_c0_g1_i3.p1  ORF type:complete len:470 (+),score=36.80 TRINITY_DN193_c0_g1_i3:770-2179(+)